MYYVTALTLGDAANVAARLLAEAKFGLKVWVEKDTMDDPQPGDVMLGMERDGGLLEQDQLLADRICKEMGV